MGLQRVKSFVQQTQFGMEVRARRRKLGFDYNHPSLWKPFCKSIGKYVELVDGRFNGRSVDDIVFSGIEEHPIQVRWQEAVIEIKRQMAKRSSTEPSSDKPRALIEEIKGQGSDRAAAHGDSLNVAAGHHVVHPVPCVIRDSVSDDEGDGYGDGAKKCNQ